MVDRLLLTPGPLTTSRTVKAAMMHDWGSRDGEFIAMTRKVRERLTELAGGSERYTTVLMQGSGTFAVEAMIGTLVPPDGKLLVMVNGAYGRRMVEMARIMRRQATTIDCPEDTPVSPAALDAALAGDVAITHVAVVHCETTSGILNSLSEVAAVSQRRGRALLVDAMSSFGALPIDVGTTPATAVAASSNKCLQGVPGIGFVVTERAALERSAGYAHSLSLDLADQWRGLEGNGQWRFTPPTHVLAAFSQALDEHAAEGGVAGRRLRYSENCYELVSGMRKLGFVPLLDGDLQAPVIVTFRMPADPNFVFDRFYDRLRALGFVIYPGKLTVADSFRVGCIGNIDRNDIRHALAAVGAVLSELGVTSGAP